jgi:hypothetical protein
LKGYSKEVPCIAEFEFFKKRKVLHIFDPVFRQNYYIYGSEWKLKDVIKDLKTMDDEFNYDGDYFRAGITVDVRIGGDKVIAIWFMNIPSLVHECVHGAHWVGLHRNMETKEEFLAYYTEWLYRVITLEYKSK